MQKCKGGKNKIKKNTDHYFAKNKETWSLNTQTETHKMVNGNRCEQLGQMRETPTGHG